MLVVGLGEARHSLRSLPQPTYLHTATGGHAQLGEIRSPIGTEGRQRHRTALRELNCHFRTRHALQRLLSRLDSYGQDYTLKIMALSFYTKNRRAR